MSSQDSDATTVGDALVTHPKVSLNLTDLPPIFLIPTHIAEDELHELEDDLDEAKAPLTYDPSEARIFLGKVTQKRRVLLELKSRGVFAVEFVAEDAVVEKEVDEPPRKRQRRSERASNEAEHEKEDSETDSETETLAFADGTVAGDSQTRSETSLTRLKFPPLRDKDTICVVKTEWFLDSFKQDKFMPLAGYIIYAGKRIAKLLASNPSAPSALHQTSTPPLAKAKTDLASAGQSIIERAMRENPALPASATASFASSAQQYHKRSSHRPAHLVHQSTSEHDLGRSSDLPEMPDWVKRHSTYSCDRSTPLHGPNDAFVEELKKIRLVRTLTSDEIGVRAYSSAIASIAAYPYTITDQREILALPGCEDKIVALWIEYHNNNGFIQAVHDSDNDSTLQVLRLFYEIWGVGARTAHEFYNKGWRDLDDIVEYGWNELSRVQQIGVKFYDEFLQKLDREEVEFIGKKIHEHAQRVREPSGVRTCIVGGHRRGKDKSGDVDIIVSHLEENETIGIVEDIVKSLFDEGWITHELITHMTASRRSQSTTPYRPDGGGHGFDTLDKALVVWQDPEFPGKAEGVKNPNVHRRVDIIIAPWSRVGCAVLGWSAGMTFERDLRRYARKVKGWKFDSSGVRDRNTGEEVDLEGIGGVCTSILEAEKKVFKGFGLEWREPWERNTG